MRVTRRSLLASAAVGALMPHAAEAMMFRAGGAAAGGGGGAILTSLSVQNYGGSALVNPTIRFGQVFGGSDVPSGSIITMDVGGVNVPFSIRRGSGLNSELRASDIYAQLPVTIAASGSATLNIRGSTGSWTANDTLPNGKTAAQIVSDYLANHDPVKVQLRGLTNSSAGTEGSGNWTADTTTGLNGGTVQSNTGYYEARVSGQTAITFVVRAPFLDNVGGAAHANLWAAFYLAMFLDTTTGAVTKTSSEVVVRQGKRTQIQDRYRCQIDLLLGANLVRSWGGNSGDGRTFNFATTDVSTAADTINLPGHKFAHGQIVRLTTTGTLPAPLVAGTDYFAAPAAAGSSAIKLYTSFANANNSLLSAATSIDLTSTGSGTHSIQGYSDLYAWSGNSLLDNDADWDWHTGIGNTSFNAKPTYHVVHDNIYIRKSGLGPMVDLSINFTHTTDPNPGQFSPGCIIGQNPDVNSGGLGVSYHMVWNHWQCQRLRYPTDRTGYVQSARARAKSGWVWRRHMVDDANLKPPSFNNTSYSGLTSRPTTYLFDQGSTKSADVAAALGGLGPYASTTSLEFSHYYPNTAATYYLDGGDSNLDLLLLECNKTMMARQSGAGGSFRFARQYATTGRTYFPAAPNTQPRSDAFVMNLVADAAICAQDGTVEKTYYHDIAEDTFAFVNWLINTGYGADFRAIGGWHIAETSSNGPSGTGCSGAGTANAGDCEGTTIFMEWYLSQCSAHVLRKYPHAGVDAWATQMATLINNFANGSCTAFITPYSMKVKDAPNSGPVFSAPADLMIWDISANSADNGGSKGNIVFDSTGLVREIVQAVPPPNSTISLQVGDRVFLTSDYDVVGIGAYNVPAAYTLYGTYFVRQVTGSGNGTTFKLATTNSDATIVSSVVPSTSTTTLAANITTTNGTSLQTAATLVFPSTGRFIRIGGDSGEVMRVVGGVGTTTLTVDRGVGGTTAATHTAGDAIEVLFASSWAIDVKNRTTGCPVQQYRHSDGSVMGPIEGHMTMLRAGAAQLYLAGKLPITPFNNIDGWFQLETAAGCGPAAFAANDTCVDSCVTSL